MVKKNPTVLKEVKRVLHDKGTLLIVDWKLNAPISLIKKQPIAVQAIKDLVEEDGFVTVEEFEAGPHHWGLVLHRA